MDDPFHSFEWFNGSKVNLPDSQSLIGFNLVPVENFNGKFRSKSRRLSSILRKILPDYRGKTYHRDFEMFIPIWRSGLLLCLGFIDLASVELEDGERIGFS